VLLSYRNCTALFPRQAVGSPAFHVSPEVALFIGYTASIPNNPRFGILYYLNQFDCQKSDYRNLAVIG
jgi:hypothetical protein